MIAGFKLPQNVIMDILTHLQASGKTLAGENVNLANDCIIRVGNNSLISITTDEERKIIMQVKINKSKCKDLQILSKGSIPINIERTKKFLNRFSSTDSIEVIYENGMILLKEPDSEIELNLTAEMLKSIRHDFINNLRKQIIKENDEKDKILFGFLKTHKSIYFKENGIVNTFNIELYNYIETTFKILKEVVKDGELLENRTYVFKVSNNKLRILIKSYQDNPDRTLRGINSKQFNFVSNFSTTYSSQFNSAVKVVGTKKLKEIALLYFGKDKPLLLIRQEGLDKGVNMSYLVMPYT